MRVLLPLHGFITWNGGVDLIRLVVSALRSASTARELDLVFALPNALPTESALDGKLRAMMRDIAVGSPVIACDDDARGVTRAAVESNATVIFPSMQPIRTNHVRKVGYLYDFQHRDLPELFSEDELVRRDLHFIDMAERSDAIFATSQSVAGRVRDMLGVHEARILALPFTPYVDAAWLNLESTPARAQYAVGEHYAMICNHFWKHKDHQTALHAFAQVLTDPAHAQLQLVMTGVTSDFRDPAHFGRILALIESLGISDRCRVLGMIPKHDQMALLSGARMLVQPTRYEGGPGGGSLYEAAGMGIPAVVSDIPVNLEARAEGVGFFKAGDVDDLAARMLAVLNAPQLRVAAPELLQRSQRRLAHSGDAIIAFLTRIAG